MAKLNYNYNKKLSNNNKISIHGYDILVVGYRENEEYCENSNHLSL